MQYALDKLSILTVLPGIRNDDLTRTLRYLEVSDVEKDYSINGIDIIHQQIYINQHQQRSQKYVKDKI